jgi:hypothetical protein
MRLVLMLHVLFFLWNVVRGIRPNAVFVLHQHTPARDAHCMSSESVMGFMLKTSNVEKFIVRNKLKRKTPEGESDALLRHPIFNFRMPTPAPRVTW